MTLDFRGQRPPQLVVGEAHNILVLIERQFAAEGRHIYLWPEATRFSKSHVPTKIGMYGQLTYTDSDHLVKVITWMRGLESLVASDH